MKYNKLLKTTLTLALLLSSTGISFGAIATDAKLQYNKGIDYYQLGQLEESAACFKNAIELDPNYIDAYYNLGSILEYLKQDEAALAVFKQIILRKPDDYESVYKAAALSQKIGEIEKAKMYLTLIPTDTIIGSKAKQLADSMSEEVSTDAQQQEQEEEPATSDLAEQTNTEQEQAAAESEESKISETTTFPNNSDGMYNDISSPTGIVTDTSGNLYVAGFSDNTIYKISPDNKKLIYIKSEKIDGPIGLAIDEPGNIYIANYNKNNILKVDKNGAISELLGNIQSPYCMYITGDLLFISSQGSNSVIRYKLNK